MVDENTQKNIPEKEKQHEQLEIKETEEFLDKIKKSKEYQEKDKNPAAYKKYLKELIQKEKIMSIEVLSQAQLPKKGNMKLETYLAKLIEANKDLKETAAKAVFKRNQEEKKEVKDEQDEKMKELMRLLNEKEETIKDQDKKLKEKNKKLAEKDQQMKERPFEQTGAPGKEKLNARLVSIHAKHGVLKTQMLTPSAVRRRMKLNKIAKVINKHKTDTPERGLRYIMAMSGFRGGVTGISALKRGRRALRNDARKNPELFKKRFDDKIAKHMPDPKNLKITEEKTFAEYIRVRATYYRDAFLRQQQQRRAIPGKKGTEKPKPPTENAKPQKEEPKTPTA